MEYKLLIKFMNIRHLFGNSSKIKFTNSVNNAIYALQNNISIFTNIYLQNKKISDYILVGPTGIFIVDIKSQDGPIAYNGNELTRWKQPFETNIINLIKNNAQILNNFIQNTLNINCNVIPVIVFSDFRTTVSFNLNSLEDIYVIQLKSLQKLILERAPLLNKQQIDAISNVIKM